MPKKPPVGRRFQPGQSGNPLGAALHNQELKALRRLTKETVADIGAMILEADLEALQAVAKDKSATVLRVWFASVAVKAISKGDAMSLNVILNRIVGKVPEEIRHAGEDGGPVRFQNLTPAQALSHAEAILKRVRDRGKPI